ncbi:UDP-glucose dehydrogenase family protein [Thermovibrio sp.]
MEICIVGTGYVGLVGAACLAKMGHNVIGVDIDEEKINKLKKGELPIYESGLKELFEEVKDRLSFTTDIKEAIKKSELCFVCVGTPSRKDGRIELKYVRESASQIGEALKEKESSYLVVYRSTIPPGTSKNLIIPTIERKSGKKYNKDFFYAFNPEFLREGTAISDFFNPPKTVIGTESSYAKEKLFEIYKELPDEKIVCPIPESEMIKYVDNSWHATKIAFANEVGYIAKKCGADGRLVMEIFCKDRKLNISEAYLKPGFAFGGSCLPKDTKGLVQISREREVNSPLIESIIPSNWAHIEKSAELIEENSKEGEIVIVGVAFKPGTDDVRESPAVYLAKKLIEKGKKVKLFDPIVELHHIESYFGKDFLPVGTILKKPEEYLSYRNLVFTGSYKPSKEETKTLKDEKYAIFDLQGVFYDEPEIREKENYYGVCW